MNPDGRTHGRRQNYIPPTSSGDNKPDVSGDKNPPKTGMSSAAEKFSDLHFHVTYQIDLARILT